MTEATGPIAFIPLASYERANWGRLSSFFWLDRIGVLPIADTEFLALAHFCPLAIEMGSAGPRPVAIVQSGMVRHRLLSDDGRWRPPYAPMALRCLPFRPGSDEAIEIAPELADGPEAGERLDMAGKKGGRSQAFATIATLVGRIQKSAPRLRNAAKTLAALDLLEPVADLSEGVAGPLHTVPLDALLALSPNRILGLTADACCSLELANALAFSRRWLAAGATRPHERPFAPAHGGVRQRVFDQHLVEPLDEPLGLDDSPLFSFDDFSARAAGGS